VNICGECFGSNAKTRMRVSRSRSPSRAELSAAEGKRVPDVVAPGLDVIFCGINPGLWSAAVGHHFARPGNRFWKVLHAAGFTEELLSPSDEHRLLRDGVGVTNLVSRATASAAELDRDELRRGGRNLGRKVRRLKPGIVAFLGLIAYRSAFDRPSAAVGEQAERLGGARLWLLPNPSGAQAHYQPDEMVRALRALRDAIQRERRPADRSGCQLGTGE
jgi:TDG/mug DNA glycosylase family protein